ncbi:MAG: dihydrolipoyl dehydrogenase [Parachlamydiales bacterium]|nr:dihydrolipoyl dehydrogenase [Parachlamydiales bacterium]
MEKISCDVAVIGAGPGGYVAAIKTAQAGKKTVLIDKDLIGGVCLNRGCIPTKCLVAHAHALFQTKHCGDFGISVKETSFNFEKIQTTKNNIVTQLRTNLEGLIKANRISIIRGSAHFTAPHELKVQGENNALITAENIILATGSISSDISAFPCDHEKIVDSTSLLGLQKLPKKLAIIGGGYIGCEFASFFAELGVEVTIFEALSTILPQTETSVVDVLLQSFSKRGIRVLTNVKVEKIDREQEGVKISVSGQEPHYADLALVSVGRKSDTHLLALDKAGVLTDPKGFIPANEKMETNVPHIYAIGDVTGKWMLAHTASHEGIVAAHNICGHAKKMHYHAVPAVIFTRPEIASVGMTEKQAQEQQIPISSGKFPFQALGIAHAYQEKEGFVHLISHAQTGQILGAHIIGAQASSLIAELTLAIQNELTLECIFETIHAHPTFPEAIMEAALVTNKTPLHMLKR